MTRRLAPVLLGALVLVAGGCGSETEARPDLAFVSTRDGDYAVFEMNADGGGQRRLTENDDADSGTEAAVFFQLDPDWSRDGTRIAYTGKRSGSYDIYVMASDGTGTRRLTTTNDDDTQPTWSSDGERIAFAREGDIYVMNADGSGALRVSDPFAEEIDPAWSPDGRFIAYVRREPGTPTREIWIMRPDGTDRGPLTALEANSYSPTWSPDGTRVAFATDNQTQKFDIYWVNVETGKTTRVTATPEDSLEPAWSPDGNSIAFSEEGAIHIAEVVAEGGAGSEKITDPDDNDSSPAWYPVVHTPESP